MVTNIKIITTAGREIDYNTAEDLSIRMNRVAADLQDNEARFGEYSYTFSLPRTSNNTEIFGFAGTPNVRNIFKVNPIDIKLYNNDMLLLTGQLELNEITETKFKCVFYSKLTQLVDSLKDLNMQDITCPKIPWNYENTISDHINAGYKNSDETQFQFPLVYYNTFFTPTFVFSGETDTIVDANGTTNHLFQTKRAWQNWYYIINNASQGKSEIYHHQIPLAFYLKPMMELMLDEIGWSMGGSFWEDDNIKSIIIPYVGDTDVYDRAQQCDNGGFIVGSTCYTGDTFDNNPPVTACGNLVLDTAKFMPDYGCSDFLSDILNIFNLYFIIDVQNKTIIFESYDVMFNSKIAPYDITNKLIGESIVVSKVDDYDPSIGYAEIPNKRILGDNRYMASSGTSAYSTTYKITANNQMFDSVYNYPGTTGGKVRIGFQAPAVKRMRIRNDFNFANSNKSAGDTVMFLPMITKQLPEDNSGKPFNGNDSEDVYFNDESKIAYNGKPCLYYYYGVSQSDFLQHSALIGQQSDYLFFNFDDVNQKIGFASPFALTSNRDNINKVLNDAQTATDSSNDNAVMLASYMQSIYQMMASTTGVSDTKDFSLIFSNNVDFGDTIYSRFHANKYKRYSESEVLSATMTMDDNDYRQMEINTPILYNHQIYSILEISNYDIVKHSANIKLIKQL